MPPAGQGDQSAPSPGAAGYAARMAVRVAPASSRRAREGGVEVPSGKGPQGSLDDVSCREVDRFSKGREERHAWSGRYAAEAPRPPAQDGEGRARARGLVARGEPHDRVGSALPAVGQQQRQGLPRTDRPRGAAPLHWVAEVVGAGEAVGRASRAAAACGDRRGACRAVGEETPWDTVSLCHPAPRSPFVRRVLGAHRGIGGGRSPQAVREQGLPLCLAGRAV